MSKTHESLLASSASSATIARGMPLMSGTASVRTRTSGRAPAIVDEVLSAPGRPLDASVRAFMEPRFGQDFSHVRIHTDARAAESARAVHARAYTAGHDIVFGHDQPAPGTAAGRRLIAHELTHVVQQRHAARSSASSSLSIGATGDRFESEATRTAHAVTAGASASLDPGARVSTMSVQRDLATAPPTNPAPAQPDLTEDQIKAAIAFNKERYNEANTRLIQRLLGGPITGQWTDENIEAIAATQETYGLKKDGKVGEETFRFLDREQTAERMSTKTADCLVAFNIVGPDGQQLDRGDATHCRFRNNFRVEAQFSPRCDCAQFEYRQFIRGHLRRRRGTVVTDLPIPMPGGVLPTAFAEDTDTTAAIPHYGHRAEPASTAPVDHYINITGADDQAHGCRYRAQDGPGGIVDDCLPGDHYNLFMTFRGEIQRNGVAIARQWWTAFNAPDITP